MSYQEWVTETALRLQSDGCTGVPDIHVWCCYEHDLAYMTGLDPRDAFEKGSWTDAAPISKREADARFRKCIQQRSRLGRFSPMSWWRWAGVAIGGDFDDHDVHILELTDDDLAN